MNSQHNANDLDSRLTDGGELTHPTPPKAK